MLAGPATQPPGSAPRSAVAVLGRELSVPFLLLLPVAGLLLLFARPELDVMYQHDPTHFWIVLSRGPAQHRPWPADQRDRPAAG